MFTGDLAHGIEPLLFEAFPDKWPGVLGQVTKLDFNHLVGGHGPVQRGKSTLVWFRDYLAELNQPVQAGVGAERA